MEAQPRVLDAFERWAHVPLRLAGYRSTYVPTSVGRIHALRVDGKGRGPTVVLLHGFSAAAIHYVPLMRRLRRSASQILALDLPAHGLSDSPPSGADAIALRQGMLEALDALLPDPAVLFGNSMGGFAALQYALHRPGKLRGLVLCSPAGAMMSEEELADFLASFKIETHAQALDFTDRLLRPGNPMRRPVAWGIRRKFSDPAMTGLLTSLRSEDLVTPEQLSNLQPKTLMVWGKRDFILPSTHREFYRTHLPEHVEWSEPVDYSHSPYLENLDQVTFQLLDFLRRV